MKTTEKTLKEIYNLGNQETKDKLEKEFPTLFKVKTLLDISIDYLTEKDEEVIKLRKLETLNGIDNLLAEQKLIVIFKAKNEKHIFNWDNNTEYKYFLWFYLGDNFRYHSYCGYYSAGSCVSSHLCLKTQKLVNELKNNEEVINLFKIYIQQK